MFLSIKNLTVSIEEKKISRNHTENLLTAIKAKIKIKKGLENTFQWYLNNKEYFNLLKNKFSADFSQSYEFTPDSNYNKAIGNNYYLSDALVESSYNGEIYGAKYELRYDPNQNYSKKQKIAISNKNNFFNCFCYIIYIHWL